MTAKGVEDTAFYVYNRLVSLNEVGGEPGRFGVRPEAVHAYNQDRQARWPYALSPLSTHDTKRSEDVRARINVLSEMPEDWWAAVERWSRLNEPHRKTRSTRPGDPRRQRGVPALPDARRRLAAGALQPRGVRGVRQADSGLHAQGPARGQGAHELDQPQRRVRRGRPEFVGRILDEGANRAFLDDFRAFQRRVSHYGLFNSLSQTLLKLAAPGRAGHLPGDRAVGLQPGGPRQPPAGRLSQA